MKRLTYVIAFFLFISINLMAQSAQFGISLEAVPGTSADWRLGISWTAANVPANGLQLTLPETIQLAPMDVRLNGRQLWLINEGALPSRDSVMAWQSGPQGVTLLYREGLVKNGDRLEIRFAAAVLAAEAASDTLQIREVNWRNNAAEITNRTLAEGIVPAIPNRDEN